MNEKIFKQYLLVLGIAALFLFWLSQYTDIDLRLADWMFDFSKREFAWKHSWFTAVFMHESMKIALIAFGLALFVLLTVDCTIMRGFLADDVRRKLHVVVSSSVLVPLVISVLKSTSVHACPWDLERYGGDAPYLRLFEALPVHTVAGHCFPAGHAASGLWLAAFAVFWLPARPRFAAVMFVAGLMPGAILGWVQQMRGAHFLTHTLWSIWIASLVVVVLARLLDAPRTGVTASSTLQ